MGCLDFKLSEKVRVYLFWRLVEGYNVKPGDATLLYDPSTLRLFLLV